MTTITRMLQFGLKWRVHLACGHKLELSAGDVLRQQLYIGKRYECQECAQ